MRNLKSKGIVTGSVLIVLLLVILSYKNWLPSVVADNYVYQIRILEITDSGASELSSLTSGMTNVKLNTMSMKRFAALRDELDGKYDAIYIGQGAYSTSGVASKPTDSTSVRAAAHSTSGVMNDITALKAQEIVDDYIDKGLCVILNKQPFDTQTAAQRGILYNMFNKYRSSSSKSNVLFVDNAELANLVKGLKDGSSPYLSMLQQRPRLTVTNRSGIVDYSTNQTHIYQPGDTLDFKFTVSNVEDLGAHPILAKLYVSTDKAVEMTESQVVEIKALSDGPNGEITYTLPGTLSGLLYWKLEITDHLNPSKLKDYDSGTIRFRGKKTVVNILQILPTTGSGERSSSLLDSNNMNQSYLSTDDYQLNISVKTITEFNNYVAAQYNADKTYGLNGVYDMLIFGFRDVYNEKAAISDLAAQAVAHFTQVTKQSVMFTHDTVYRSDSSWVSYFKDITGQIEPLTNLGLNAPNTSKTVTPVNDGLLTQFPFYLSTLDTGNTPTNIITPAVATTHNQYYTLNLEDPTIIPWYNITGGGRDVNDSWNHYYTYSKGNVTYSGTGHIFGTSSTEKFPVWEQKLFVNTMYRAYIGSNHKPEITVNAPKENDTIPTYENEITVDYRVEDPDLYDRDLYTTIRFQSGGKYLTNTGMPETAVLSGHTVHQTFSNPLPEGGDLTIEISARDKQGALADTKLIPIRILKANANLDLSRTLSSNVNANGEIPKDQAFTITYLVKPKAVPLDQVGTADQNAATLLISDIVFQETLPPNLQPVSGWPDGMTSSGNTGAGYTLNKPLGNVTYSLKSVDGVQTYVPDSAEPITFSIQVKATAAGVYNLDNGQVSFVELHSPFDPGASSSGSALGFAGDYNALVFGTANVTASLKGNLAAEGNTTTSGVDVNQSLGSSVPYAIVTGGDLDFHNGTVYGNILHQGSYTKVDSGNIVGGTYAKGSLIDFEQARSYYQNLSDQLAGAAPNGTQKLMYGGIYLYGTGTGANSLVNFKMTSGFFDQTGWANVDNLSGQNMVYTITGSTVTVNKVFALPNGVTDGSHVIYNFPDATAVNISGVDLRGSVLAPRATVHFTNGQIHGNVIAASLQASSLIDVLPYKGPLPVTPPASNSHSRNFIKFPRLTITAIDPITSLSVEDATLLIGDRQKLSWSIEPVSQAQQPLNWSSSDTDTVTVSSDGIVYGKKAGTAVITASATDGSGKSDTATVTVRSPNLTITGKDSAKVNETLTLTAEYTDTRETGVQYIWSAVNNATGQAVTITASQANPAVANFTAAQSGSYTITVVVKTDQNPDGVTATKTVTIGLNGLTISGEPNVYVGTSATLTAVPDPITAALEQYEWSLVDSGDLQYGGFVDQQGQIVASLTTTGTTVQFKGAGVKDAIGIVVKAAGTTSSVFTMKVLQEPNLQFYPTSGVIAIGEKLELLPLLHTDPYGPVPDSILPRLQWSIVDGGSSPAVSLTQTGTLTGLHKGSEQIRVSYQTASGNTVTATYTIKVTEPDDTGENRY
ncbi:DUF5057 domain-containing protein [Paenibacillus sp. HN-1]|uniref:DUF5057 domain-containing protein n=1 Tax=Paenibacillus TaxID=44249 RepID=UPI001CA93166|nr:MULTISPECIES: DUF5057 domain-containing protein [Paenibacillus]MBY9077580.1 DUF5057 domain-containing protein [Paenibacillus sp. CGMCC 1.18879]MBY9087851.1 DUF5057 domain-containing protein [Paenibacillus sinensis]